MREKLLNEITLSVILASLVILFLDPFMLWMPAKLVYVLIGGAIIVFTIFAGLVWRERANDERDDFHRMLAGRIGYILGSGILLAGIVWQTIVSQLDPWLIVALVGMVLGKLGGHYYGRTRR